MNELVYLKADEAFTDSLVIAASVGKRFCIEQTMSA